MKLEILLWFGLILYSLNYIIGWSLFFGLISMRKLTHQIIFAAILVNLFVLLLFLKPFSPEFIFCGFSFLMMIILPFGRKGEMFHRIVSSTGFIIYIVLFAYLI